MYFSPPATPPRAVGWCWLLPAGLCISSMMEMPVRSADRRNSATSSLSRRSRRVTRGCLSTAVACSCLALVWASAAFAPDARPVLGCAFLSRALCTDWPRRLADSRNSASAPSTRLRRVARRFATAGCTLVSPLSPILRIACIEHGSSDGPRRGHCFCCLGRGVAPSETPRRWRSEEHSQRPLQAGAATRQGEVRSLHRRQGEWRLRSEHAIVERKEEDEQSYDLPAIDRRRTARPSRSLHPSPTVVRHTSHPDQPSCLRALHRRRLPSAGARTCGVVEHRREGGGGGGRRGARRERESESERGGMEGGRRGREEDKEERGEIKIDCTSILRIGEKGI